MFVCPSSRRAYSIPFSRQIFVPHSCRARYSTRSRGRPARSRGGNRPVSFPEQRGRHRIRSRPRARSGTRRVPTAYCSDRNSGLAPPIHWHGADSQSVIRSGCAAGAAFRRFASGWHQAWFQAPENCGSPVCQLGRGEDRPQRDCEEIRANLNELILVDPQSLCIQVSSHAAI